MPRGHPTAADWNLWYASDNTPWDIGEPHPELVRRLADDPALGTGSVGRAFVPGCGLGHDAFALAEAGWEVTAVDLAELDSVFTPLLPTGRFVRHDALAWEEPADLWFDHTFFCAIDPDHRTDWGEAARRVVIPGATLISLVFPLSDIWGAGPPFGMSVAHVSLALGPEFELVTDGPATSPDCRPQASRWAMFRRSA